MLSSETNNQRARLFAYLKQNGSIDTITAREKLGILSPAPRIRELIKQGYSITRELITVQTPLSKHIRVARYHLNQNHLNHSTTHLTTE